MVPWKLGRKRPQVLGAAPERRTHRKPDRLCSQRQAPNPSPRKVVPSEGTRCVRPEGGTRGCCRRGAPSRGLWAGIPAGTGGADTPHACPCRRVSSQIARDRPPHVPVPGWGERGFSPSAPLAVTAAGCGDGSPGRCARSRRPDGALTGRRAARDARGSCWPGSLRGHRGAESPACHPRRAV